MIGVTRETVSIPVAGGEPLEGELAYPDAEAAAAAPVLVVGPHPYMGGTRENNVVAHLAAALAEAGRVTLRFSYRPVPAGERAASMAAFFATGHAPEDPDLVVQADAARGWLAENLTAEPALVGYSFGAFAASETLRPGTPAAAFLAPTVERHGLPRLTTTATPKLVLSPENDFATPAEALAAWLPTVAAPLEHAVLPRSDHFFRGHEGALAARVLAFLGAHP